MQKLKLRPVVLILKHALFLLLVWAAQALVLPFLPMLGLVPLLLPIAVVGTGLFEGVTAGGVFGLFAGLLCDSAFNEPAMLFTVYLTAVGLCVGYLGETVLARGYPSFLIVSAAALIVAGFIQCFEPLFFRGEALLPMLLTVVFQTVYSAVFTVPMYFISRALWRGGQTP